MGYADAIEQQHALVSFLGGSRGLDYARALLERADREPRDARLWCDLIARDLASADTYFVAASVVSLLTLGAEAWRGADRPQPRDAPAAGGWVLLDRALPQMAPDAPFVISALSWHFMPVDARSYSETPGWPATLFDALVIGGYAHFPEYDHPLPIFWETVPLDPAIPCQPSRSELAPYVRSLFAFVRQRLVTISPRPVLNRGKVRQLPATIRHDPQVRVVQLRAHEYQRRDSGESEAVDWSCQWPVRPHWHLYHTKGGPLRHFVGWYIKGPADKPLRVPTAVAYEVVR
jgi:hypothetical protein